MILDHCNGNVNSIAMESVMIVLLAAKCDHPMSKANLPRHQSSWNLSLSITVSLVNMQRHHLQEATVGL